MGSFSIWHWLIVLVIVLLLFGAGKIPKLMGDMAKGVKAFKKGLNEEDEAAAQSVKPADSAKIEADAAAKPAEKDAARH
ncbi:MAG: sec-independent protein translocase protein TatA [Stygiobacter sp.]|nr:MAG: sec-independent protein translocase protein TatA [Stygiobacter sp.]